ncbi:MAG TPA: decaprenyl-phosphate phosphoribosyltransferase [Firmicutes bacterium]|jgi:4-hydroxybenzoate polyprenyltransferase|nr:decaprenyl-phosphate phosphoribosyltransferase [Bacillota bacterium]
MSTKAVDLFLMLRPKQWTKNLLLFAGLIFSLNLFVENLIRISLLAFVSFCLLSSSVYIVNDLIDMEEDKKHPLKRHRPLAAGKVGVGQAMTVEVVLLGISLFLAWRIGTLFLILGLVYFALCLAYSLWLKYTVILDVFAIALGFLLRVAAGGVAIGVVVSPWLLICTLLISLFLALAKRRQESINLGNSSTWQGRAVLEHYPIPYLDQLISIVTAATILAYSLYTFTASRSPLYMLTIPFVIYGIFRYLYLVHNDALGENPEEILLSDWPTIINIILWVLATVLILYMDLI